MKCSLVLIIYITVATAMVSAKTFLVETKDDPSADFHHESSPELDAMPGACDQPKGASGGCEAYMEKWTFDKKSKKCEMFVYGGCGGNDNAFYTKAECETKCAKKGTAAEITTVATTTRKTKRKLAIPCKIGKKRYHHGEVIPYGCNTCICFHGKRTFCTELGCPLSFYVDCEDVTCDCGNKAAMSKLSSDERSCCKCPPKIEFKRKHGRGYLPPPSCTFRGKKYKHGENWPSPDGCNRCNCEYGNIMCTEKECVNDESNVIWGAKDDWAKWKVPDCANVTCHHGKKGKISKREAACCKYDNNKSGGRGGESDYIVGGDIKP